MMNILRTTVLLGIAVTVLGCDGLTLVLTPTPGRTAVAIELVNTTDFTVTGDLFSSDQDDIPKSLLTNEEIGDLRSFSVPTGLTERFSLTCENAQAIVIDKAEMQVLLLSPEEDTGVLYDGDDFRCGDTITFMFSSDSVTDLRITTSVQAPSNEGEL